MRIYMDYQASTPMDRRVFEAMQPFFSDKFGNPHSSEHSFGWDANEALEKASQFIARQIGAETDEFFFTSGATEANNIALLGFCEFNEKSTRRKVLTSTIEHKSVLDVLYEAGKKFNLVFDTIAVDKHGFIDLDDLSSKVDHETLLVSVMHTNNEIGTIQDISKISDICHKHGVVFHSDATQGFLTSDIDVRALGVDMLSFSGHKIYAPKGIGGLYIRRELQNKITPRFYGGGQQAGVRPGTVPVHLCCGLRKAVELIVGAEAEKERKIIRELRNRFVEVMQKEVDNIDVNGPMWEYRHPGNANICFEGIDASVLLNALQPDLAASSGSACSSGQISESHVLSAIGFSPEKVSSSIRFSIGRFTTEKEVQQAIEIISDAVKMTRKGD